MELWVRSQDKEAITKVNMGLMYWEDVNKRNCIVNKDNATGFSILGSYKTKERALEILDEIQRKIVTLNYQAHYLNECFNLIESNVYEMPAE